MTASSESFAAWLGQAEDRLRAHGLSGRAAYGALCRRLAFRLGLPRELWLEGPDLPPEVDLADVSLTAELDLFGLAYERFFPEVFKAERGQFFTPRPLVELMADLAHVRPGERVLDPTCGSGAFLVVAAARGANVDGIEVDPELVALCRLNLKLHGVNPRSVRRADLFREPEDDVWDVILANPPFSVDIDHPDALRRFALTRGRRRVSSDELFVEAAWRRLRPGGRLATVMPFSVLANPRYDGLRDWIDERFVRRAVISLPEGVFRPFGGTAARACVLCLAKRPAELKRWLVAQVRSPGYDPTRKVYKPCEPDELALLRLALRDGSFPTAAATRREWVPDALLADDAIAPEVPTTTLGELARIDGSTFRPSDRGDDRFTEIDLADVDKGTGEVTSARARDGREFVGPKVLFEEGDILFGRMRPNLNNVALAARPDPSLPAALCGSSEWARLRPSERPHFALVAARSTFVRAQLRGASGQTRPRVGVTDLPAIRVPFPGEGARDRIERIVGEAHAQRLAARRRLDAAARLYEAYGAGELDEAALIVALDRLG